MPVTADQVADFLEGKSSVGQGLLLWRQLITSQLDVDRADYLLRDSHHVGVEYGRYDLDRLVICLTIGVDPSENPHRQSTPEHDTSRSNQRTWSPTRAASPPSRPKNASDASATIGTSLVRGVTAIHSSGQGIEFHIYITVWSYTNVGQSNALAILPGENDMQIAVSRVPRPDELAAVGDCGEPAPGSGLHERGQPQRGHGRLAGRW